MIELDLRRLLVVPRQQGDVNPAPRLQRGEKRFDTGHDAVPPVPRLTDLLDEDRHVARLELRVRIGGVGNARAFERRGEEIRVSAAGDGHAGESVRDTERRGEGPGHGAHAGAAAQEQRAVDIEEHEAQSSCSK